VAVPKAYKELKKRAHAKIGTDQEKTPSPSLERDLIGQVAKEHGLTREKAEEMLDQLGW
jgi:hypothetical protein